MPVTKLIGFRRQVGRRALNGEGLTDLAREFGVTISIVNRCAREALEATPGYEHEAFWDEEQRIGSYGIVAARSYYNRLLATPVLMRHITNRFERVQ